MCILIFPDTNSVSCWNKEGWRCLFKKNIWLHARTTKQIICKWNIKWFKEKIIKCTLSSIYVTDVLMTTFHFQFLASNLSNLKLFLFISVMVPPCDYTLLTAAVIFPLGSQKSPLTALNIQFFCLLITAKNTSNCCVKSFFLSWLKCLLRKFGHKQRLMSSLTVRSRCRASAMQMISSHESTVTHIQVSSS